jgi:hypothetical protein
METEFETPMRRREVQYLYQLMRHTHQRVAARIATDVSVNHG